MHEAHLSGTVFLASTPHGLVTSRGSLCIAMHGAVTHDTHMTCCLASNASCGNHEQQAGMHVGKVVPDVLVRC